MTDGKASLNRFYAQKAGYGNTTLLSLRKKVSFLWAVVSFFLELSLPPIATDHPEGGSA